MKIKSIIVFCIFLLFPLIANSEEMDYVVKSIKVSEVSTSASKARKKALKKGQKQAFDILLNRMEIDKNNAFWISDEEIEKMVGSIKIDNEQMTQDTYSAILDVTFDKEFTKYIFNKHSIDSQSTEKNKYLVIPVTTKDGEIYIWEAENVWLKFWQRLIKQRGIKSIIVPERDIDSLASIDTDIISFNSSDDFTYLTDYYEVNSVIIVNAKYLEDKQKIEILFTKVIKDKKNKVKLNFFGADDLDKNTLFLNATGKTIDYIVKTENAIAEKAKNKDGMMIKVSISNLNDYMKTDTIMKQLDFLNTVKLNALSKKLAEYHITYDMGDYEVLAKFEEYGFFVKEKEDGFYLFLKAKYNLGALL